MSLQIYVLYTMIYNLSKVYWILEIYARLKQTLTTIFPPCVSSMPHKLQEITLQNLKDHCLSLRNVQVVLVTHSNTATLRNLIVKLACRSDN